MAKLDMKDLSGIDLTDLADEILGLARKRAMELVGRGGKQVKSARRAIAGPSDGDMFGAFALGLLVGSLIGAALALLLAPFSGVEARRKLGEQVETIKREPLRGGKLTGRPGNGESVYQPTGETTYPGGARPV